MIGRRREQAAVVGIATYHAVQGHYVRGWEFCGHRPKVGVLENHAIGVAQALRLLRREREIGGRCVDVRCLVKALIEQ